MHKYGGEIRFDSGNDTKKIDAWTSTHEKIDKLIIGKTTMQDYVRAQLSGVTQTVSANKTMVAV